MDIVVPSTGTVGCYGLIRVGLEWDANNKARMSQVSKQVSEVSFLSSPFMATYPRGPHGDRSGEMLMIIESESKDVGARTKRVQIYSKCRARKGKSVDILNRGYPYQHIYPCHLLFMSLSLVSHS